LTVLQKIGERFPLSRNSAWHPVLPPPVALLEFAGLFALIYAVDWAFPALNVFSLEPSPFWLPLLLLTLQYGTIAGLAAAAAATVAHILNGFPEQGIGENLFNYFLKIWALPMLWVGIALLLGQFRLRQIEAKRILQQSLAQKSAEARELAVYSKKLDERCHALERAMSAGRGGAGSPAIPVLDSLVTLAHPPADVGSALQEIAEHVFPGAALSIFSATAAGCDALATSHWGDEPQWSKTISSSTPLFRALVVERRQLSILNSADEAALASEGLAACPIFAPETNRVIGFVKLERADPALFGTSTPGHLALIAQLAAPALSEPRIVVDNSSRAQSDTGQLTVGWSRRAWAHTNTRLKSAQDSGGTAIGNEHSTRPTRLS
jgi:polysaccharide biosynthesis protein PelD